MTLDNKNLYEMLFPDCDDDFDNIGRIRINEIFSNMDVNEIPKYFDLKSYNSTSSDNEPSTFRVIHFNIRNLLINKDELESLLSMMKHTPDVICLSETWLDSASDSNVKLDGFICYNIIRDSPHSGVSIFVRNHIKSNIVSEFSFVHPELEICTISISISNTDYIIAAIYRPRFKYFNIPKFREVIEPISNNKLF